MQYFYAFECTFETKCPKVEAVLSQCRLPFFSCPALSTFFVQSIDISPDLLLLFLYEYRMFNQSFTHAAKEYGKGGDFNEAMSKVMGFESEQEFNNVMFLREVMRFINSTSEISDIVRVYAKQPELARTRLKNLLSEHSL